MRMDPHIIAFVVKARALCNKLDAGIINPDQFLKMILRARVELGQAGAMPMLIKDMA